MFLVYINGLPDVLRCTAKLCADDTKVYRSVAGSKDQELLHNDTNALEAWTVTWQLPFSMKKCNLMHMGNSNQNFRYHMTEEELVTVNTEMDLEIFIDNTLEFHEQMVATESLDRIPRLIKCSFVALASHTLPVLFKTMVRLHLECSNSVWGPTSRANQNAIE